MVVIIDAKEAADATPKILSTHRIPDSKSADVREGKKEEQWMLHKLVGELKFMDDWLPPDGSNHEGPGYGASSGAIGMAFEVSDACVGTHYLDKPFFRNLTKYAVALATPGFNQSFYFSDCFH